jgi:hypothetical protein
MVDSAIKPLNQSRMLGKELKYRIRVECREGSSTTESTGVKC